MFFNRCFQGLPGPESERNAIEVVLQYAVEKLGFSLSNIVIYAWSIGECLDFFKISFSIANCSLRKLHF